MLLALFLYQLFWPLLTAYLCAIHDVKDNDDESNKTDDQFKMTKDENEDKQEKANDGYASSSESEKDYDTDNLTIPSESESE